MSSVFDFSIPIVTRVRKDCERPRPHHLHASFMSRSAIMFFPSFLGHFTMPCIDESGETGGGNTPRLVDDQTDLGKESKKGVNA